MATEWIRANLALKYAAFDDDEYLVRSRIIERANAGLIQARAETLLWDDATHQNYRVPPAFWRTDELSDDLTEDWGLGNFERRSRFDIEEQALGVSFDFLAISELVSADRQAHAMRRISIVSNEDWIRGHDLHRLMSANHNPSTAGNAIIEACQLGQIAARATRMTVEATDVTGAHNAPIKFAAMEWDVPLWFWREMIDPSSQQQWSLNKVRAVGYRNRQHVTYVLQGVHFHRSGLINIGLASAGASTTDKARGGRNPKYDWPAACLEIFGDIHRGDLKPEYQADVERALISLLTDGEQEPSASTVRPYARLIWNESRKD